VMNSQVIHFNLNYRSYYFVTVLLLGLLKELNQFFNYSIVNSITTIESMLILCIE